MVGDKPHHHPPPYGTSLVLVVALLLTEPANIGAQQREERVLAKDLVADLNYLLGSRIEVRRKQGNHNVTALDVFFQRAGCLAGGQVYLATVFTDYFFNHALFILGGVIYHLTLLIYFLVC